MSNVSFISVFDETDLPHVQRILAGVRDGTPSSAAVKAALCVIGLGRAVPVVGLNDQSDSVRPTETPQLVPVVARLTGFNGQTFDRLRSQGDNADAQTPVAQGSASVTARLTGFNGSTYDRLRSQGDHFDAQAPITRGSASVTARLTGFNGSTYDRVRTASAAVLAASNGVGAIQTADVGNWSIMNAPAAGVAAAVTRTGEAGRRHVITSIAFSISAAVAQTHVEVDLVDGSNVVWRLGVAALAGDSKQVVMSGLSIVAGTSNSVTLRFVSPPAAGNFQRVSMTGYTAQ